MGLSQDLCRVTHTNAHTRDEVAFWLQINSNYPEIKPHESTENSFQVIQFMFFGVSCLMCLFMRANICWATQNYT